VIYRAQNFCKFRPLEFNVSAAKKPTYAFANMKKMAGTVSQNTYNNNKKKTDDMKAENKILKMK